ncbi:MAG: Lrp/AsnC family transcriptional regulator [Candidatus Micrarchaeia archaeon]|jgi:DNA-binding Lrp family transcriptional regulator
MAEIYIPTKKERRLLSCIDFDCRTSDAEIGRRIGVSKQGVSYLLRKLEARKVIKQYYPVINIMNLGCNYTRFFVKFRDAKSSDFKAATAWLDRNKVWYLRTDGAYDFLCAAWSYTYDEFKEKTDAFYGRFSSKIKDKRESLCIELRQFKNRWLFDDGNTEEILMKPSAVFEPDETDRNILRALEKDARSPLVQIAARAKCSPPTAAARIGQMEKAQVILGYRPSLNLPLLGYSYYKVFFYFNSFKKSDVSKFLSFLSEQAAVTYMQKEIGRSDLDVEMALPSNQDFFSFMREISYAFPGLVKEYEFLIVERESNVSYLPSGF